MGKNPIGLGRTFTMSPDQKGIETFDREGSVHSCRFTMSPDQKGIETSSLLLLSATFFVHTEPRSKGD